MRIICPNCDAEYEVEETAIPLGGRDVQCSNCGHGWFQMRSDPADAQAAALYEDPVSDPSPRPALNEQEGAESESAAAPPRPRLDDAVLAVLREEAARELAARKAEAQGIELQGDLGLPPPVSLQVGRAPLAGQEPLSQADDPSLPPDARRIAMPEDQPVPAAKTVARRDLLPDIEEINSTLRPGMPGAGPKGQAEGPAASGGGFRSGFSLILVLAAALVALYVMAPQLAMQVPGLAPALESYVVLVDGARQVLDGLIRQATGVLQGLSGAGAA